MNTKKLLFPFALALSINTYSNAIIAPEYSKLDKTQRELMEEIAQTRLHQETQNNITKILSNYPSLSYFEAKTIIELNEDYEIKQYSLDKKSNEQNTINTNLTSLLTENWHHKDLFWANYDQLPDKVLNHVLDKMFKDYKLVLSPQYNVDTEALLSVPEPVLLSKYFIDINKWTRKWNPQLNLEELHLMEDFATSILLQESFATRAALIRQENNPQSKLIKKSDYGLFQISPAARLYLMKDSNFRGIQESDFLAPNISIKAGTFWLAQCLRESKNDFIMAIGCYNAGIGEAKLNTYRSSEYISSVLERLTNYIVNGKSKTLNYSRQVAAYETLKGIK